MLGVRHNTLYQYLKVKGVRPVRRIGMVDLYDAAEILHRVAVVDGRLYDLDKARQVLGKSGKALPYCNRQERDKGMSEMPKEASQ